MTAIVTDINEYRERKNGVSNIDYFSTWSDRSILARYKLLGFIENGSTDLIDMSKPIPRMSFPDGFDPENHPGENIKAVYAEGVRRGVFVKSE